MNQRGAILFTAFEPSGDEHAAPVIAALREQRPDLTILAMGGPRMAAAGASLLEVTTEKPAMLADAVAQVWSHRQRVKRFEQVMQKGLANALPLLAHVPVDSPAANWALCEATRRYRPRAKVVHLVAPQMWAWAPQRVVKLQRLSDMVLCLLPFEPAWFGQYGIPTRYVGHPLFDAEHEAVREAARQAVAQHSGEQPWPRGDRKLALLPGSRSKEISRNWPAMLKSYLHLFRLYRGVEGVIAARTAESAEQIKAISRKFTGGDALPEGLTLRVGETDRVLAWCDAALVVSGTASLQTAAHRKPMVIIYRASQLAWRTVGQRLIQTRTFGLPNVVGERTGLGRVSPELVPFFGDIRQITDELSPLLADDAARASQREKLEALAGKFAGPDFAQDAAAGILDVIG